jgi:DNA-binding Lrp family transcriptional regulator
MKAYILITTQTSQVKQALASVREISQVKAADPVTGPFDIIALIEGADMKEIGDIVVNEVQKAPGISRTLTCLVVED